MTANAHITDHQRFCFMQKFDAEVRAANGLLISPWEQDFLASWRQSSRPSLWFTPGRQGPADKMWMKYAAEIKLPFPQANHISVSHPKAETGCCMFLKRDDERRLMPCNSPAVKISWNGFLYCAGCADEAVRQMKRKKINMVLQNYQPGGSR